MSLVPSQIIVAVHGVRSSGEWGDILAAKLKTDPRFKDTFFLNLDYPWTMAIVGWFQTLLPWSRHTLTDWMERQLARIQEEFPLIPLDVVAHSYGCWIVHYGITRSVDHPTIIQVRKFLMIGSVVRELDPLLAVARGQITRVVNYWSRNDLVVQLVPPPFGHAGQTGLKSPLPQVQNVGDLGMGHEGYFSLQNGVYSQLLDALAL